MKKVLILISLLNFTLIFFGGISFTEGLDTTPDSLKTSISLKNEIKQSDTTAQDTSSPKVFIPGLIQYSTNEKTKARIIIWGEIISLVAGGTMCYLSNNEYSKYKNLPNDATKEEFDYYINKSNLYGTISAFSFIGFGIIYFYSLNDAVNCLNSKRNNPKGQGFYLTPREDGLSFYLTIKL